MRSNHPHQLIERRIGMLHLLVSQSHDLSHFAYAGTDKG